MKEILIVGAGEFGRNIAERFTQLGEKVLVIDLDERKLENIRERVSETYIMDITDKDTLESKDLGRCDLAVITIGENFSSNLLAVILLRQLGIKTIVSRASNEVQQTILTRIGCDMVLFPEEVVAKRLVEKVLLGDIEKINIGEKGSIVYLMAPQGMFGKKIGELELEKNRVELVFIQREFSNKKGELTKLIRKEEVEIPVENGDYLVLYGLDQDIKNFLKQYQ
ncbi:TrkA family potassium uptake protein [bacterium]|nr:TrkA family potassium uptake protein [bacterium]